MASGGVFVVLRGPEGRLVAWVEGSWGVEASFLIVYLVILLWMGLDPFFEYR